MLTQMNIKLPNDLKKEFKAVTAKEGTSMNEVIEKMIIKYIKNKKK